MKSRALRLTLFTLVVGLLAGAAYVVWTAESQVRSTVAAARAFDTRVRAASRVLLDVKSAQPGYVAAGQGDEFWAARVDSLLASGRDAMQALHAQARSPDAQNELEAARSTLEDFEQMDRRARDYARSGQRLLASDLVFADGLERIDTVLAALTRAGDSEQASHDAEVREQRRAQMTALGGAAAFGLLITFSLVPLPRAAAAPPVSPNAEPDQPASSVALRRSLEIPSASEHRPVASATGPVEIVAPAPLPAPVAAPAPAVDLPGVAALCTELARVLDTRALPGTLARAAALLDASGVVIWVADPDGRELAPVVAHGYPEDLLARMGTIDRDAENATASAFRTGLVQTVKADAVSHGAIAAPLMTPAGPVGVMAAELLHDGELRDSTRAVAAIVAAQLATLMGPPAARPATTGEVAQTARK